MRFDGGGNAHVVYKGKIGRLEERIELMMQKAMKEKEEQFLKLGQSLGAKGSEKLKRELFKVWSDQLKDRKDAELAHEMEQAKQMAGLQKLRAAFAGLIGDDRSHKLTYFDSWHNYVVEEKE